MIARRSFRRAIEFLSRIRRNSESKGICYIPCRAIEKTSASLCCSCYRVVKGKLTFTFQERRFRYFYHTYNTTYRNERAVEVPIVLEIVKGYSGKRVLEVGNVLSHYFSVSHDIVDKYERSERITNLDVVDFHPCGKYDLIVSISTLEHFGWDESPREPAKILRAIENLKSCLAREGEIVITLPLGLNPYVDNFLREGKIRFAKQHCMKRISKDNRWVETDWNSICHAKYGTPFPFANAIVIGFVQKGPDAAIQRR